tara:strand:+ start:251 stop:412 length:162 start_codon:yes stop_codon:yes gene_type:complete
MPPKKTLTKAQQEKLKEHGKHHSKKHIDEMKKDMLKGMSFSVAHMRAQKKVGK